MVKRYVVTSAQACAPPNAHLLEGINAYAKATNSEIIVLPMIGKNAKQDMDDENFHKSVRDLGLERGKPKLNSNIQIEQFNVRPYQIDPLTGLDRFAQRETTLVFASPKQRLKPVSHSPRKMAKYLVTTGALTRPNYATGKDTSAERRRLGDIARRDHIFGGLVVEVQDDEIFFMRHLRANHRGDFVDLGVRYSGKERKPAKLEAMVLGDYHNERCDMGVKETTYRMIEEYQPERLIIHDFFDGHSVSHHIDKQYIEQKLIQQKDKGHHELGTELRKGNEELKVLSELMQGRPIYIIPSNHLEFLNRYLNEGRFMHDPTNARLGFRLASYMALKDQNNPVEHGIKLFGKLPKNIKFLKRDEDLVVRGYHLGSHGDRGAGGGRSSMKSKEDDFGKSVTGHVHKMQVMRDTYTVGTMLPLDMYYMRGYPSDWANAHAMLYDTGTVQLVSIINKKWKT